MKPLPESHEVTEAELSEATGVKRCALSRIRAEKMEPGVDFAVVSKKGVTYTPAGLEKMKAALPPEVWPQKNGAPPAPESGAVAGLLMWPAEPLYTLVVRAPTFNGRVCLAQIEGHDAPHRAFVKPLHRLGALTLSAGLRLEGCRRVNDELFEYPGPVPQRRGQPLPVCEKKEAAR